MTVPTLSKRKKALFSLALFAALVSAGTFAEGVLRITCPWLAEAYAAPIDPNVGYGVTLGHRFSLNRFGFREADFPVRRPAGETRILCLGDSITFGYELTAESAWPKILEKNLQDLSSERIFCINAAGNAATTHQALTLYDEHARGFGASTVVLGFCMNDVRLKEHRSDVRRAGLQRRGSGLGALRYRLRRSYLFSAFDLVTTETIKRHLYPLAGKSWLEAHPYQLNSLGMTAASSRAWRDTLASLDDLDRQVAAEGSRMVVAAFPYQFQISNLPSDNPYGIDKTRFTVDPFERLRTFCAEREIAYVDLREVLATTRRAMLENRLAWNDLYIDYCHPNATGQALAARSIENAIIDLDKPRVPRWSGVRTASAVSEGALNW
jgi:hypothetical protein